MALTNEEVLNAYMALIPRLEKTATAKVEDELEQTGSRAASKFGSALSGAVKVAGATIAAGMAALGKLAYESFNEYANYEQLKGGVETLFGAGGMTLEAFAEATGKTVEEVSGSYDKLMAAQSEVLGNADKAYQTAGMSANDYIETVTGFSASLIQSLGGDTAEAARIADMAIVDMADNANKMGSDISSIQAAYQGFAKQNFTMLDNLKLGYGGTKTEMERLLKDAQKLSGVKYDISSYADIAEAIHVIQENMGIAGTTAKEAAETISGSLGMLKGAWGNLIAGLGNPDQDLDNLIDNVMNSIDAVAGNAMKVVPRIADGIVKALPKMAKLIADKLPELFPTIIDVVVSFTTAITDVLPGMVESLVEVLTSDEIFEKIIGAAIDIMLALVNAIPRLLNVLLPKLPDMIEDITQELTKPENLQSFIDAATSIAQSVADNLPTIIIGLLDALPGMIDNLLNTEDGLLAPQNLKKMVEAGAKLAESLVQGLISAITNSKSAIGATLGFDSSVLAGGLGVNPALLAGATSNSTDNSITIGNVTVVADSSTTPQRFTNMLKQASVMAGGR